MLLTVIVIDSYMKKKLFKRLIYFSI